MLTVNVINVIKEKKDAHEKKAVQQNMLVEGDIAS